MGDCLPTMEAHERVAEALASEIAGQVPRALGGCACQIDLDTVARREDRAVRDDAPRRDDLEQSLARIDRR